ncbi:hypothetical protein ACSBR1_010843 [Camellia fascicularis]
MERLDRALSNPEWRIMFPEATVKVLPHTYSDHSPLLSGTERFLATYLRGKDTFLQGLRASKEP